MSALLATACTPAPLVRYDLHAPAAALVPIGYAGTSDERPRFREMFCAIRQARGALFPNDRQPLRSERTHRLLDEPRAESEAGRVSVRPASPAALRDRPGPGGGMLLPGFHPAVQRRPAACRVSRVQDRCDHGQRAGAAAHATRPRFGDAVADMPAAPGEKLVFLELLQGQRMSSKPWSVTPHSPTARRRWSATGRRHQRHTDHADDASEHQRGRWIGCLPAADAPPGGAGPSKA
ncbi:MAG: hypothetical protein M0C28_12015 [Candidatus Moduliflexus flocculans]|nr:hypothetical protein [Candidatus Moduliflexus flocculans]